MTELHAGGTLWADTLRQAIMLHRQGQFRQAQTLYEKILKRQPRQFDALHLLGVIAAQTNNPARAVTLIGRAIDVNPHIADAHCNQGSAFKALNQFDEALHSYDRALAIQPGYCEALCCRSEVLGELRRWEEALSSSERALQLNPSYPSAYLSHARALVALGHPQVAVADYDRAISLNPGSVEIFNAKGILLRKIGDRAAALACFDRAIAIDARYAHAHLNRGNVFMDLYRLDEALASFDQAIALKSDFAEARANRASILLLRGDFAQGWSDYEWRWKAIKTQQPAFSQPPWSGKSSIAGKTVLLVAAQGLGDTLQFCRYATQVASLGASVILRVPASLVAVLATLQGVAAVQSDEEPLPKFDVYCRITSLPLAFNTTLSTIPARIPYLHSSVAKTLHWRRKLGEKVKLRVGLAWSGLFRPGEQEGWSVLNHRIIPLAQLAPLKCADIEFYSLQKGQPADSELANLQALRWNGPDLIDHSGELLDFSDTAAFIEQLDLVISVDTSTAHLAGALGKPVWILLCFDSCWRWLTQRTQTPWYPTASLYRQDRVGDWSGVIERVRRDLDAWVGKSGSL